MTEDEDSIGRSTAAMADAQKRARFLNLLRNGVSLKAAAREIGASRQAVYSYAKHHMAFRVALETAREEGNPTRKPREIKPPPMPTPDVRPRASRMALPAADDGEQHERVVVDGQPVELPDGLEEMNSENVARLCWFLARCPGVPAPVQTKALDWCAKRTIGVDIHREQREIDVEARRQAAIAERDAAAEQTVEGGPLIIAVPTNGSEAPGREPVPAKVVDAEVVH